MQGQLASLLKRLHGPKTERRPKHMPVPVPKERCRCPECGNTALRRKGQGKASAVYEFVQSQFRKRIYRRETPSRRCGKIVTASAPDRVGEKTRCAPSFVALMVVSRCGDSIPYYRMEKAYRNIGIPMSRSTMCNLFHRAAEKLRRLDVDGHADPQISGARVVTPEAWQGGAEVRLREAAG